MPLPPRDPLHPNTPLANVRINSRNLPHWRKEGCIYWVTFRMGDSIPQEKLQAWQEEREIWIHHNPKPWSDDTKLEYNKRFGERMDEWLDAGMGSCALRNPEAREIVRTCLYRFDGERLLVHATVIMPNHVHTLLEPLANFELSQLLHGIKLKSAHDVNILLSRTGRFWQDESFDRIVREEQEYRHYLSYIAENPLKASLQDGDYWLHLPGVVRCAAQK
jgi:REP element-mobilizing transposase RayT